LNQFRPDRAEPLVVFDGPEPLHSVHHAAPDFTKRSQALLSPAVNESEPGKERGPLETMIAPASTAPDPAAASVIAPAHALASSS
jgi:hypothetical protein